MMTHLRPAAALVALAMSSSAFSQQAGGPTATAAPQPQLDQVLDTQQREFGNFKLAPIIVPEGEEVGDLIDPNTTALIARAEDCFDGLRARKSASQLPSILTHSEKEIAAGLGVGGTLASASGEGREGDSFILEFADVQVAKVSLVQLRETLKKDVPECQELRPFIDAAYTPAIPATTKPGKKGARRVAEISSSITARGNPIVSDKPPPLLLGTVFTARRVIRIESSHTLGAKAKLSLAQGLIEKLGLGSAFEASAAGNSETTEAVVIEAKEAVPVAFAPAFVVKHSQRLANGSNRYEVAAVDADQIEASIAMAKANQDESLMAIEQAIGSSEMELEKRVIGERFHAMTVARAIAESNRKAYEDAVAETYLESHLKGQPVTIALDPDWRFKLVQKAILPVVATASKRDVYQKVLGVDGIKFLPMTH